MGDERREWIELVASLRGEVERLKMKLAAAEGANQQHEAEIERLQQHITKCPDVLTKVKQRFTIHKNDTGTKAYSDQYVKGLEKRLEHLRLAVTSFAWHEPFFGMTPKQIHERLLAVIDEAVK